MVTYEKFAKELIAKGIDKTIIDKLVDEYRVVKRENLLGDHEKVVLHAAKVSDLVLALIKNKVSGEVVDVNSIHFNKLLEEIKKYPKTSAEEVILTLAIPRVAESIYTIRSKKDVAHVKTIDPSFIDSSYCVSACDWMLSELALLFYKADPKEANELISSMLKKKVPTVEEFEDGSIMILRKDLTVAQQVMLILYYNYPKRVSFADVTKTIKSDSRYIIRQLWKLQGEKLIHGAMRAPGPGLKLTRLGIKYVEDEIITKKT